jgi:hypothetical protein
MVDIKEKQKVVRKKYSRKGSNDKQRKRNKTKEE